jgi:hypothetical protein
MHVGSEPTRVWAPDDDLLEGKVVAETLSLQLDYKNFLETSMKHSSLTFDVLELKILLNGQLVTMSWPIKTF